jgi:hypothetical protein
MITDANWVCVYKSTILHNVELVRHLLGENDINGVVLNQKDSFYPTIGEIQLFVPRDQVMHAKRIIHESEL